VIPDPLVSVADQRGEPCCDHPGVSKVTEYVPEALPPLAVPFTVVVNPDDCPPVWAVPDAVNEILVPKTVATPLAKVETDVPYLHSPSTLIESSECLTNTKCAVPPPSAYVPSHVSVATTELPLSSSQPVNAPRTHAAMQSCMIVLMYTPYSCMIALSCWVVPVSSAVRSSLLSCVVLGVVECKCTFNCNS
jgi:hypothetical protein